MSHRPHDLVSLEMARRIARGLKDHPEWIELAKSNLDRWEKLNYDAPRLVRNYHEWRKLLDRPVDEIISLLTTEEEEADRLRRNFAIHGSFIAVGGLGDQAALPCSDITLNTFSGRCGHHRC